MKRLARIIPALVVACALTQCSLWVSSEPELIGCADEGKRGEPACDDGYVCMHHECVSGGGGTGHGPFPAMGEGGASKTDGEAGAR